jgi:NAD(P)-dependent dehydrogenase (short-subunit alcohol dehydrogenase family)
MAAKKVVVAGATGLVGNAALRHFGGFGGCEVVALSRRRPRDLHGARHVPADLTDPAQCARAAPDLRGATHLVYAALFEAPNLVDGWRDANQIRTNDAMLRNLMAALEPVAPSLRTRGAASRHQGLRCPCPSTDGAGARRPLGNVPAAEFLVGAGELSSRAAAR